MHVYVVENLKRISILVNLVIKGAIAINLTTMIKIFITKFGGLSNHYMAMKVVCLGPNGASTFQGIRTRVSTQLKKYNFFCIPIHYVVHMINLLVITLFYFHIVVKIEMLFKASTHIWVTTPSKTFKDGNWLRLWKRKISKYCGMLGANGLVWFLSARWLLKNSKLL